MTLMTTDETRRWEAAAAGLTPKLASFHESLSADEQVMLAAALGQVTAQSCGDVDGYRINEGPTRVPFFSQLQNLVHSLTAPINWDKAFTGVSVYFPQ